jgi:hypothetical protein
MEIKEVLKQEIKIVEKDILNDKFRTAMDKVKFVNEIKTGLGQEIKKNPNKVKINKKTFKDKFLDLIKKIFTKF